MLPRAIRHCLPRVSAPLYSRALSNVAEPAAAKKTYYDVLNITRKATDKDVKEAYRTLAKKYHPDRNADDPEAEAHFKEVQEAHATLSDRWKRALYDQDIQFGSMAMQDADTEHWKENFEKETPEEREARKERYRRYASGERNDLPPVIYNPNVIQMLVLLATAGCFYIMTRVPDWIDLHSAETYNDPATDDRTVPLVLAFHDPILNRWERVPDGCDAPSPMELYRHYMKAQPDMMKGIDLKVLPKVQLTVLRMPRTDTVQATYRWSTSSKKGTAAVKAATA
mmetsp:Transcript_27680/g.60978  ORF Transcript_27680/g.60978 Transcript_27680/m.60978 type:complete len:282 (+) Transcript_27680:78-923(+)